MSASDAWVRRHPAYRAVVRDWPERALLACSGGIDSSALLVLAGIGKRRGDIRSVVVVHVDHRTRTETESEGAWVERLGSRFDLETIRERVSPEEMTSTSSSPEDRLRVLRYSALARVASRHGIESVVTAHTMNDQVETILMRLLSGSGGTALSGMAQRSTLETRSGSIEIVRPLLGVSRDQLEDVLRRSDVTPLEDPSNQDRQFRRNAVRHDLIPLLSEVYPGFERSLVRSASLASRDADALDQLASELMAAGVRSDDQRAVIDRGLLRTAHPAVASRIIKSMAGRLMPDDRRELTFERVESVRHAVTGRTGAVIELPYGVIARVERHEIVLERRNI